MQNFSRKNGLPYKERTGKELKNKTEQSAERGELEQVLQIIWVSLTNINIYTGCPPKIYTHFGCFNNSTGLDLKRKIN